MKSAIALILCIAVAQTSVDAFSMLAATKVVAPTKGKAAAKKAPAKKAAPANKKLVKVAAAGAKSNLPAKNKAKLEATAKAKAALKAKTKAKADAKAKANAAVRAKNKAKAAADEKAKAAAKAAALKKAAAAAAFKKRNVKATTSETAFKLANAGVDPALVIAKGAKLKKQNKQPLFPGLQATNQRPKSTVARKKAEAPAKAKSVKKAARETDVPVSPIEFGLQVAQSDKGQEAIGILIEGGLKFVEAVLDEGKKTKVVIPRGYDTNTGALKKPRIENVGYKQLLDAGIFAGQEFFTLAKTNYERFYVGGEGKGDVKVFRSKGKTDDRGNVIKDVTDNYFVNIGGQRVAVKRRLR